MIDRHSNLTSMDPLATVEAYDRIMSRVRFSVIAKRILKLGIKEGKLLDVACGPGHLLVALARLETDLRLYGMDISPNMLEACRKNLRKRDLQAQVELEEGSSYDLPFAADTFDLVVSTLCLHFMDDADRFFQQITEVLRPGGIGYIYAFRRDVPNLFKWAGRLNSRWRERRNMALEGFDRVLDASYTAAEVESCLRKLPLSKFEIKQSLVMMTILLHKA